MSIKQHATSNSFTYLLSSSAPGSDLILLLSVGLLFVCLFVRNWRRFWMVLLIEGSQLVLACRARQ